MDDALMAFWRSLDSDYYCSKCNATRSILVGAYCPRCGSKLCNIPKCECGIGINPEHKFCSNCGMKNEKFNN